MRLVRQDVKDIAVALLVLLTVERAAVLENVAKLVKMTVLVHVKAIVLIRVTMNAGAVTLGVRPVVPVGVTIVLKFVHIRVVESVLQMRLDIV